MNTISYKGYTARIEPDLDDGILVGRVINTHDIIGFHGETVSEAIQSFHAVIDEYIEDCQQRGLPPDQPYSESFDICVPPQLYGKISDSATKAGKSINQWVVNLLEQAAHNA